MKLYSQKSNLIFLCFSRPVHLAGQQSQFQSKTENHVQEAAITLTKQPLPVPHLTPLEPSNLPPVSRRSNKVSVWPIAVQLWLIDNKAITSNSAQAICRYRRGPGSTKWKICVTNSSVLCTVVTCKVFSKIDLRKLNRNKTGQIAITLLLKQGKPVITQLNGVICKLF